MRLKMEMKGEQIIKKAKKAPKWVTWGYVICIIVIIGAAFCMEYRIENQTPEAIDFTTEGAIGMETGKYAYLKVEGLTDEVAIYGNTENQNDSTNDRYYIAISEGYMYIVDLNFETIDQLKPWQDYLYSMEENPTVPEPVTIYGMTEEIPTELKQYVIDFYNESVSEAYQISLEDFEIYFGSVLLNVREEPVDTSVESIIIMLAIIALFIIVITHISIMVVKSRVKKYIKKNGYEEELARQLDDNVEEKHYNDKVIITKDFFVDLKSEGFVAFNFSDVKWVHIHNIKYYGTITVSSSIVVHLKDGKTNFQCVEIKKDATDEFMGIFNRICEKVPADTLVGYTQENQKAFKEYKKEVKRSGI